MELYTVGSLAAVAALVVSLGVRRELKRLAERINAIEIDRASLAAQQREQAEQLACEVGELRHLLQDLADFQKAEGRYRHEPDDPRLPAHIRDRLGIDD